MPFEVFEPQPGARRGVATIRFLSKGRIHLNAAAARMLGEGTTHVQLLWDAEDLAVALKPVEADAPHSYLVSRAPSQAVISAAGFAERCRIPLHQRYRLELDEEKQLVADIVLDQDLPSD
ncbi:hypothetical protein [uncultured Microbacterium sp.]|uniref:hypothetical protein n=1 Tax=uncultured Microbacterium sp. TaxID=191216 RepID=UPI0025DBB2C0|nr:hypothetical protein [uncultured Microbacterium sp.]